jgi:hypothetical protein
MIAYSTIALVLIVISLVFIRYLWPLVLVVLGFILWANIDYNSHLPQLQAQAATESIAITASNANRIFTEKPNPGNSQTNPYQYHDKDRPMDELRELPPDTWVHWGDQIEQVGDILQGLYPAWNKIKATYNAPQH